MKNLLYQEHTCRQPCVWWTAPRETRMPRQRSRRSSSTKFWRERDSTLWLLRERSSRKRTAACEWKRRLMLKMLEAS